MATDCHFPAVDLKMPELTIILAMYWFNTCRYGITAVNMLCTSPKGVTPACLVLRLLPRFVVHQITTAGGAGATNKITTAGGEEPPTRLIRERVVVLS